MFTGSSGEQLIRQTNVQEILTKTASDIKTLRHITKMCMSKKANEKIYLRIASIEEIMKHKAVKPAYRKREQDSDDEVEQELYDGPLTNIAIIGGATVNTIVDADHRIGPMSFVLHGDIPEDLVVNIRERRKP